MHGLPQIRLRTVFFLVFCAAVGLAIGTSPEPRDNPMFTIFGWQNARLNWHYGFMAAGSVAVITGLVQEVARLKRLRLHLHAETSSDSFGRLFAITWRVAIVGLLTVCLLAALLISRGIVRLPETETFFSYELFPYAVWAFCLIVVLSASVSRWQQETPPRKARVLGPVVAWIAAVSVAALILLDVTFIHYLVHLATEGISNAQSALYEPLDRFPNHRAEGYRSIWIAAAASMAIPVAAAALAIANQCSQWRAGRFLSAIIFMLLLCVATCFCVWYYGSELRRISPFFANAGGDRNSLEWFAGMLLALIFITAIAYRLSRLGDWKIVVPSNLTDGNRTATYETAACLLVLIGSTLTYMGQVVTTTLLLRSIGPVWWGPTIAEALVGMLRDPGGILMVSILALCAQLCVLRWRRRSAPIAFTISRVGPLRFIYNWLAVALLTCVAIPTLAAALFVFWLGPWYLYGS